MKILENNKIQFTNNFLFYICIIGFLFIGVYARINYYLLDMPFWLDEINLALSYFDRDFWGMFTPLEGNQKTPPLFCAFVWVIKSLSGECSTFSLRFLSLFCGISAMVAFFFLLKDFLKSRIAIIVGMFIFAINVPLIYYSQEFKPYSSDVLVCILLILLYKNFSIKNDSIVKTILFSILFGCSLLFSFPCMFIISAMILLKLIEEKCFNKNLFIIPIGFIVSALYLYFLYREIHSFEIYEEEWQVGFLTFSFNSFWTMIKDFVYFLFPAIPEYSIFILFLLFVWGLFLLFFAKKQESYLLLLIILFAVIASFLKIYPLKTRMILYFIPIVFLAFAKVIDSIRKERKFESLINVIIMSSFILFNVQCCKIPYLNLPVEQLNMRISIDDRSAYKDISLKMLDKMTEEDILFSSAVFSNYAQYYSLLNKEKVIFSHVQMDEEINELNIGTVISKLNEIVLYSQGNKRSISAVFLKENCKINGEISLQVLDIFEQQINIGKYLIEKLENDKLIMYRFYFE